MERLWKLWKLSSPCTRHSVVVATVKSFSACFSLDGFYDYEYNRLPFLVVGGAYGVTRMYSTLSDNKEEKKIEKWENTT